jgi:hypothetical protein
MSSAYDTEQLIADATLLAGGEIRALEPVARGGNNRLYRLRTTDGHAYALKTYLPAVAGERDRLGAECASLAFLQDAGEDRVPRFLDAAPEKNMALFDWVAGDEVSRISDGDIDEVVSFVESLKLVADRPTARVLPLAAEACLASDDLTGQIHGRFRRLADIACDHEDLRRFLEAEFAPAFDETASRLRDVYTALNWSLTDEIPERLQTLSPSDFGFHNALRQDEGLVFLDFEYFGWDDPVKLAADFLLHPGMSLTDGQKRRFLDGVSYVFADDADFRLRLCQHYPLYALRWAMIVLNEFLPEKWRRRKYAGTETEREAAQLRQLEKARMFLITARGAHKGGLLYDA